MKSKPRLLGPKVFAAGIVAGLVAGLSGGCSRSSSANVDLKKAREALAKRRSDYGESPRSQTPASDKAPTRHR
jgi:hypothetical protein